MNDFSILNLVRAVTSIDIEIIMLAILLLVVVVIFEQANSLALKRRKLSGMVPNTTAISVDGSKSYAVRQYVSEMQGLAGRPDALILEHGFIIPIERKPLARKLRDRYVAQLLVYMRLIEEFEGKKPPYGYLLLGPSSRRLKIENTDEKQAWLQKIIDEMRSIVEGGNCKPDPHPRKCKKCNVKNQCNYNIEDRELNTKEV